MDPVPHAAPGLRPLSARLRGRWLALLAVVCVLVALVHWPVLTKQALSVDDGEYLTNNRLVQHPSWESARRFLSEVLEPSTVHGYYQPLTMISLMLDYAFGGRPNDLRVFHRTSLALHVVNTALVIVLLYQLFGNAWAAALAGLLFGAHPLMVEPIAWVADRKTLLSSFFALSCLNLYTRFARAETRRQDAGGTCRQDAGATAGATGRRRYCGYFAALLLFVLALLSKPTSTPLPLLLLILDWWPLRRLNLRALIEKIPFLVVATVSAVITVISQARTGVVSVPTAHSWMRVPLLLAHNIVFYLYKLLWPAKLSSHYPFPEPVSLAQPMVLAGVIGTLVIVAALVISLRWTRSVLAGFLFFLIAVFPSMGVLGFTNVVAADKHAYLPMIGLLLPLAYGICRLWRAKREGEPSGEPARPRMQASWARQEPRPPNAARAVQVRRAGIVGAVCALALTEAFVVRGYLPKWNDSETLFRHMIALAPNAPLPHYGLGTVLKEQKRFNDAAAEYMAALQLKPDYADAHNNLGLALAGLGRNDEAIDHYRQAVQIKPDHADAQTNLGHALLLRGEADEAIAHYRAAVQSRPRDARAHMNLGMALRHGGQPAHALPEFQEALRLDPHDADIHTNLAFTLAELGRQAEAIEHYRAAVRLAPDSLGLMNNLAWNLATRFDPQLGDALEAVQLAEQACARTKHRNPQLLDTLAAAYAAAGRFADAVQTADEANALASKADDPELAAGIRERRALYQAGRAYREPTTKPSAP